MDNVNRKFMSSINNFTYSNFWSLEDGYTEGYEDNSTLGIFLYPYRVFSAGYDLFSFLHKRQNEKAMFFRSKAGLKVAMATFMGDIDYACRGPVQGFKVILHTPNELPQVDGQYFRIPVGQDVRVSIKPNVLRTTKSLTNYKPNRFQLREILYFAFEIILLISLIMCRRQCFFNFERKLRYMRTYTKRNCELECLTNFTLESCGCVKFSMPHDDTTPICGIAKVNCYTSAENEILEYADAIESSTKINSCNCLPACTSISYDTEISQATYEWKNYFHALNFTDEESDRFISLSQQI